MNNLIKTASVLAAIVAVFGCIVIVSDNSMADPTTEDPGDAVDAVAMIGNSLYETLQEALDAAQDGDTVQILTDIELDGTKDVDGATIKSGVTIDGAKPDGGCYTISSSTAYKVLATVKGADFGHELTIRNLNIVSESTYRYSMCLYTGSMVNDLVLENVTLKAENASNTQPLTIGGVTTEKIDITITGSTIVSSSTGYSIIVFNPVDMDITGTHLEGWATVYMKYQSGGGTHGSVIDVADSEIVSINQVTGPTNDFSTLVSEDRDVTFNLTDVKVTIGETAGNRQSLFSSNPYTKDAGTNVFNIGGDDTAVTLVGENVNMLNVYQDDEYIAEAVCTVTGGTYGMDVSEFVSEGCTVITDTDGNYRVVTSDSPEESIGGDGQNISYDTEGDYIVIDSDGTHEDVTLDLGFGDTGVVVNADITGRVTVGFDDSLDAEGYDIAFDLHIEGVESIGMNVVITIPVDVEDGYRLSSVVVHSVYDGAETIETAYIDGDFIVIETYHNTPFYVSYEVESELPPFIPFPPEQGGDPVEVYPSGDSDSSSNGGDDTLKVVAVAAAAVIAAILAIVLASTYRKD